MTLVIGIGKKKKNNEKDVYIAIFKWIWYINSTFGWVFVNEILLRGKIASQMK